MQMKLHTVGRFTSTVTFPRHRSISIRIACGVIKLRGKTKRVPGGEDEVLEDACVDWVVVRADLVLYRTAHAGEGVFGLVLLTIASPRKLRQKGAE